MESLSWFSREKTLYRARDATRSPFLSFVLCFHRVLIRLFHRSTCILCIFPILFFFFLFSQERYLKGTATPLPHAKCQSVTPNIQCRHYETSSFIPTCLSACLCFPRRPSFSVMSTRRCNVDQPKIPKYRRRSRRERRLEGEETGEREEKKRRTYQGRFFIGCAKRQGEDGRMVRAWMR